MLEVFVEKPFIYIVTKYGLAILYNSRVLAKQTPLVKTNKINKLLNTALPSRYKYPEMQKESCFQYLSEDFLIFKIFKTFFFQIIIGFSKIYCEVLETYYDIARFFIKFRFPIALLGIQGSAIFLPRKIEN